MRPHLPPIRVLIRLVKRYPKPEPNFAITFNIPILELASYGITNQVWMISSKAESKACQWRSSVARE